MLQGDLCKCYRETCLMLQGNLSNVTGRPVWCYREDCLMLKEDLFVVTGRLVSF